MNLTLTESRILRREVSAVDGLFRKGLLTVRAGAHVELSESGRQWLAADAERVRLARIAAGKSGGTARADTLSRKERVKIARKGAAAAKAERKRKKKGTDTQ